MNGDEKIKFFFLLKRTLVLFGQCRGGDEKEKKTKQKIGRRKQTAFVAFHYIIHKAFVRHYFQWIDPKFFSSINVEIPAMQIV